MFIRDIATSPRHRVVLRCDLCDAPIRWEGAALALRFADRPDLTLADLKESAACPTCGGDVTVTVETTED